MSPDTRLRLLNLCSLGGFVALGSTLAGWLIAGLLPLPLGPSDSQPEVFDFYTSDSTRRMIGFVLATVGICFIFPLVGVISMHMMRMEGRLPLLSFLQLGAGSVTMFINLLPSMLFAVLCFRPETRSAETISLLNDVTWLIFFTPIMPFIFQNVAIGVAILSDRRETFPRWVGYVNLLVAFAFVPDVLAYFFLSGPFGWNGVFVFWLALTAYSVFLVVMGVVTRRANAELVEASTAQPPVPAAA
ncbi:MAG: hypothetical protein QM572_02570 [Nocardioides sp.]|uniref:hypothetical protein n=1 Tax=Nocardioides sp. TaxID=35761 RepID=UPI0039E37A13